MNELSPFQRRVAQQLMNTGLAHAAQAFSQIANQAVDFETPTLAVSKLEIADTMSYPPGDMTLLTTDIIGETGGRSYLLLSEPECIALQHICLPATTDVHQRTVMEEAVLKEIDNIVTAAVITKLSESLDLRIFGGVPRRSCLPAERMQEKLCADFAQTNDDHLWINTHFRFEENNQIQPQFFWELPSEFLQSSERGSNTNYQDTSR